MDDELKAIKEKVDKDFDMTKVEEMIKNNIKTFEYKEAKYRVRPPNFGEKQKAYDIKVRKYVELLNDPSYKLEKDLKQMYKERGTDVDDIITQINNLEIRKHQYEERLGKLLEDKGTEEDADKLRREIIDILGLQYDLSFRKTNLLQYSIENQVLMYVYRFLTYTSTEKCNGEEKWTKAWDSFEEFCEAPEELVNQASFVASLVIGQI